MDFKRKLQEMASEAENLLKNGNIDEAASIYRQIVVQATSEDGNLVILSLLRLGEIAIGAGNIDMALECYKEVEERSLADGFTPGLLDAVQRRATLLMASGRWEEALETAMTGSAQAKALEDKLYVITFKGLIGQIYRRIGDFTSAAEHALDGLALAQQESNYDEELTFLSDLVLISLGKGDFDEALKQADLGLRRAEETGRKSRKMVFLGQKSQALLRLGKTRDSRDVAREGLEAAIENDSLKEIATFHHDLAQISLILREDKEGLENSLEAYRLYSELGNKEGILATLRTLNRSLLVTGDWDAAFRGLVDALVLAVSMNQNLFFSTFRDLSFYISTLCEKKDYEAIEKGLSLVDEFFASIKEQLYEGRTVPVESLTEKSYLSYVEELLKAFRLCCKSSGDRSSESAKTAFAIAEKIDSEYGGDSASVVELFYK